MDLTLLILAAGMGSRYGGLKQLDAVGPNNEAIIDYSVFDAIRAGFKKIVFVIRKDIEAEFKDKIGSKYADKIKVEYAYQELDDIPAGFSPPADRKKPWGTGHAILAARDIIKEPFSVINADDFYGTKAYEFQSGFLGAISDIKSKDFAMVGYTLNKTLSDHGYVSRAVCSLNYDSFLEQIEEYTKIEKVSNGAEYTDADNNKHPLTGNEIVSMNMWGFTPAVFNFLQEGFLKFLEESVSDIKAEFFFTTVLNQLCAQNTISVKVIETPDAWFGVTYPQDKQNVVNSIAELIDKGVYPNTLW